MDIKQAMCSAKHSDYDEKEHPIIQELYKEVNRLMSLIERTSKEAKFYR